MVDNRRWSFDDEPAQVIDLGDAASLEYLQRYYGQRNPGVLREVIGQAWAAGAQMAVVEYRYIDADYRDEHSRFYSTTFRRYPSVAHRIHFFTDPPPPELGDPIAPARFAELNYLGYAVVRPVPGAPAGRVMLKPPDALREHITCVADQHVNLLGEPLRIQATPFIAQDAQLIVCAHAALWMAGNYHHMRWGARRLLPSTIADAVPIEAGYGRAIPSAGLTLNQMSAAATKVGLPPLVYELNALPPGETMPRIACRYLNSGFPVIVAGGMHAFVLIGYERIDEGTPDARIHFIRHDDEVGPYQVVENFHYDQYSPWEFLIVPLPNKVYLAGEEAEVIGSGRLRDAFRRINQPLDDTQIAWRTTAMLSNDFKAELSERGMPDHQAAVYRRMPMSKWIWVVEAVDRSLRRDKQNAVIAETIIDATDHARDRHTLAWRAGTTLTTWTPDTNAIGSATNLPEVPPLPFAGPKPA